METIRVGVIGTGYMGKNHLRVYSELDDVKLVACSDIDEQLVGHNEYEPEIVINEIKIKKHCERERQEENR